MIQILNILLTYSEYIITKNTIAVIKKKTILAIVRSFILIAEILQLNFI